MSTLFIEIIVPFLIALFVVALIHSSIVRIAKAKEIVDRPDERKLQRTPVPILGGVCVFIGIIVGLGCASAFLKDTQLPVVVMAMTIMLYVGTMDDILDLSARLRLFVEVLTVVVLMVIGNYTINDFHGLWGYGVISGWLVVVLTLIASVGIINAINLIDGVNGLSSGFCIMACVMFGTLFYLSGDLPMAVLAAVSAGALVPFLLHNVYGVTSKMFIGDGGTLMQGIMLSVFVIRVLHSDSLCAGYVGSNMGLIPFTLAVMSVPIFDTLRVMIARISRRESPFHPDKTHLHHLFIEMGFTHAGTTLTILALNCLVVLAWWGAYAVGVSIDWQLGIVVGLSLLITLGVNYVVVRMSPTSLPQRILRLMGRYSHFERTGLTLWFQRAIDRI